MVTIEHTHTDNAVCPHCGHEERDSWELGDGQRDSSETDCARCGKPFYWERIVSVCYSTLPASSAPEAPAESGKDAS